MLRVSQAAKEAALGSGLKPALYFTTDVCDGVATGHDGMNYSLPSRDIISAMVEIHALACPFDGIITFSSCDKALPGHLMTLLRLDMPGIHVSGGSMDMGPGFISPEICYETNDLVRQGRMTFEEEMQHKLDACPSCGACQYMGTASSMQVAAEALGMSLPGNALIPADGRLEHMARRAGEQIGYLIRHKLTPTRIMTPKAFENALVIHAAVGGSSNLLLHLPAIASQAGHTITLHDFDDVNRRIPVLCSMKTSGDWPTRLLWYAGGVPALMRELKGDLHLDVMTVTGKTLRENLEYLEKIGFFERQRKYLSNYGLKPGDIIHSRSKPFKTIGNTAALFGNIATEGAIVKLASAPESMQYHKGPARPFNNEEDALSAIDNGRINPGDVIIIRFKGPRGAGMPEMLKTTEKIYNCPDLSETCVLITDGRFSGATRGPAIGHVSPEAQVGGAISLIEEDDLILVDIEERRLELIGVAGEERNPEEICRILDARRANYIQPRLKAKRGVLDLFARNAGSVESGVTIFASFPLDE
ncbi:dihydroxy-acid dehydratase [Deltaproteobacteria bacterium]|nr:dihydroxy-acid dehydratase [Deltaproteobacteria bacterium]